MAMGKRPVERQQELRIPTAKMPQAPGQPFCRRLNEFLARHGFDRFVEGLREKFYHDPLGRLSIPLGVYFPMLLVGYFEGIDTERGIAWRSAAKWRTTPAPFWKYGLSSTGRYTASTGPHAPRLFTALCNL